MRKCNENHRVVFQIVSLISVLNKWAYLNCVCGKHTPIPQHPFVRVPFSLSSSSKTVSNQQQQTQPNRTVLSACVCVFGMHKLISNLIQFNLL